MVNVAGTLARRMFAILCRCSLTLGSFDTNVVDGIGAAGAGRLARAVSRMSIFCEAWIAESPIKAIAEIIWGLSFPVRMIQTGALQSYMLLIVVGLVGFLGYYLYLAHHAIH